MKIKIEDVKPGMVIEQWRAISEPAPQPDGTVSILMSPPSGRRVLLDFDAGTEVELTRAKRYSGPPTRELYPDETIPGWLRAIRDGTASIENTMAARLYGADQRTRDIAGERLDREEA